MKNTNELHKEVYGEGIDRVFPKSEDSLVLIKEVAKAAVGLNRNK